MKPLTIDELKALQVCDWIWDDTSKDYLYILDKTSEFLLCMLQGVLTRRYYSDNGTKWLAYKNKEQAEKQTKYNVGDTVWYLRNKGYGCTSEESIELVVVSDTVKRIYKGNTKTTYYLKNLSIGMNEKFLYKSEMEAQQRLKELQGESK